MGLWIYMLMLYVSTWLMGYFVSITVSKQQRSVVNVALALFWGFGKWMF